MGCVDSHTLCGGSLLDAKWLQQAHAACPPPQSVFSCRIRLGRYWNETVDHPEEVLNRLEELDEKYGRDPLTSVKEIGRFGGDSTCSSSELISMASFSPDGTVMFGDGANGTDGKTYSGKRTCAEIHQRRHAVINP